MRRRSAQPGLALLAVLVVITVSALVVTTVMTYADAESALGEASMRRTQSLALAWSGVQAAMSELDSQREQILDGRAPSLTRVWDLYTEPNGDRGIVRLLPIHGGLENQPVASENGKLDVNSATAEMLASLDLVDEALAAQIVADRPAEGYQSVESLLGVQGVTPELLYGPGAAVGSGDLPDSGDLSSGIDAATAQDGDEPAGLVDVLTVFSFDPNIQAGLGADGASHRGDKRINLNMPWSSELGDAIARRFDQEMADGVQRILERGTTIGSDSDLVRILRFFNVEPAEWARILDAFTTTDSEYLVGRVDLNTASAAVLAGVPGIDESAARQIVQRRQALDPQTRTSVVWPVIEGILDGEQMQEAVDHLSTRSMQWRVRIEAGVLPGSAVRIGPNIGGSTDLSAAEFEQAPLRDAIVVEAVIDIASGRPRVAYLREVTMWDAALNVLAWRADQEGSADQDESGIQVVALEGTQEGTEQAGLFDAQASEAGAEAGAEPTPVTESQRPEPSRTGLGAPAPGAGSSTGDPASTVVAGSKPPDDEQSSRLGRWTAGGQQDRGEGGRER